MNNKDIAKVCHDVNRAYCQAIGDDSQVPWDEASEPIQKSALMGVEFHLANDKTPEESHNSWMANKIAEGWVYGELKDEVAKTHHCLIPYGDLPVEQKVKDYLFKSVVESMSGIESEVVTETTVKTVEIPEGKLPVKYIGKRPRHIDGMYGTLLTWVKDETLMIPEKIARKMFKHIDVYKPGVVEDADSPEIPDTKTEDEDSENNVQDAKDVVNSMRTKQAVRDYVQDNFSGMKMGDNLKLKELKQQAEGFIDQYGIN